MPHLDVKLQLCFTLARHYRAILILDYDLLSVIMHIYILPGSSDDLSFLVMQVSLFSHGMATIPVFVLDPHCNE